ncbi:MAG: orotidine-5'-phosphate decarboxylase [Zetaproteobacteria bacterium]|nr:orotidine-5'-phosphate decarboxylase [Zetaproteobacteria bacterium]
MEHEWGGRAVSWKRKWQRCSRMKRLVCVGLDPDLRRLPKVIATYKNSVFLFNKELIDATADLVMGFKFQMAHYGAQYLEDQLLKTTVYLQKHHPEKMIILDGKRGDIGSTAEMYAKEAYGRYGADAVTLNPYMGWDSVRPFVQDPAKMAFVLCRTSNPTSLDFQDLVYDGQPLYQRVAQQAVTQWSEHGNIGLVVGATFPQHMANVRRVAPEVPFLVPGVGFQGGSVTSCLRAGGEKQIFTSSRGVIYASPCAQFADKARTVVQAMDAEIRCFRPGFIPNLSI